MENISIFDIISLALIFILGTKGVINGFIKEAFGLIGIIGGLFVAFRFAQDCGELINRHVYSFNGSTTIYFVGFIFTLLLFWMISIFIGFLLKKLVKMSALGGVDRSIGFVLGCAKVFLVFSILTITLTKINFIDMQIREHTKDSFMYPVFLNTGAYIFEMDNGKIANSFDNLGS